MMPDAEELARLVDELIADYKVVHPGELDENDETDVQLARLAAAETIIAGFMRRGNPPASG